MRTKKLIPGELYEPPKDLPLVTADKSFNEPRPSTSNAENEVKQQVKREGKKKPKEKPEEKPNRDPVVISIGKKKFKLIKVEEEKSDKEKLDKIFAIPKAKKSMKMVGCCMPGLPHCVLSQAFCDKVKEIEDKKKEKQDAIEKRKAEQKAKAEWKKEEKKKAVKARKAEKAKKKGAPTKRSQCKTRQRKVSSSSSENEEAIEYADSSSEMSVDEDKDEALLNRCSECGERFKKDE